MDDKVAILADNEDNTAKARDDEKSPVKASRLIIVEPIIFLYGLTTMIQYPVFGQYLYYAVGQKYNITSANETRAHKCEPYSHNYTTGNHSGGGSEWSEVNKLQEISTMWTIYTSVASGVPAVIISPFLATLTDKLGRKWPIVAVCALDSAKLIINTINMALNGPLVVFVITSILSGLSGGMGTLFACIFSYLADVTTTKERPFRITVAECLFGVSGVIAEIGVGYWLTVQSYYWPYGLAAILTVVNLLYTAFFVPETRKIEDTVRVPNATGCQLYKRMIKVFTVPSRNSSAMIFALIGMFVYCMQSFSYTVQSQYQLGFPFCWDSVLIGINSAISMVFVDAGMLVGAGIFTRYLGMRPLLVCLIGIISSGLSKVMIGLARNTVELMLNSVIGTFSLLPIPMIRSFLSIQVSKDEQGAMFASISFAESVTSLFGTTVVNLIYGTTVSWFPGFTFLVLAATAFVASTFISLSLFLDIKFGKKYEAKMKEIDANGSINSQSNA